MIGRETRLEAALTAEAELISDLVVIGGGAAGMTAASRARRLQPSWRITVGWLESSCGRSTIGSFSLKEVLSTTGTPVSFSNSLISCQ